MRKLILLFVLSLLHVIPALPQADEESSTLKSLRENVKYLSSAQFEGRRAGEQGATSAAGYVANKFAQYRLKAGASDKSFLQAFPYVSGVELEDSSEFKISNTRELNKFENKIDWAPFGSSPNALIPFSRIVFAGYGITANENDYDNYRNVSSYNAIVVAFDGLPDNDNPHNSFSRFNAHAKARLAKQRGANALVLISRESEFSEDKSAMRFDQAMGETAIPVAFVSRKAGARILNTDEQGLIKIEAGLNGKENNSVGNLVNLEKPLIGEFIINLKKRKSDNYNVIGVLEGKDPKLRNEIIVIGAHYDHLGRGGQGSLAPNSNAIHHGADDNASGTSALLELARRFSVTRNNKRTIVFIAFGGEEEGLLGSNFFVNNPTIDLKNVTAMVNMDMIGRLRDQKLTVGGIGTATELRAIVNSLNSKTILIEEEGDAKSYKTEKRFELQLNEDGYGPSDHSSFYGKKIPVLFFFTGIHDDYHKPTDTADKINYKGLEEIAYYVFNIVKRLDLSSNKLTYKVAKSSGMGEGRRGFRVSLGTIPSYADGNNDGLLLEGVRDDSPAAKAGIKPGDKIIKLAGKEVRNISDYVFALGEMKPDVEYEIVVTRGSEKLSLKITPKKR